MIYRAILFITTLTVTFALEAQESAIDAGSIIIGGTANLSSFGGDGFTERITTLSFGPFTEYFVVRNVAVGGTLTVSHSSGTDTQPSITAIGVGPRVGYYAGDSDARVYPFIAGSLLFTSTTFSDQGIPVGVALDFTTLVVRPSGGLAFMVAKNVAVVGEIFYELVTRDREGTPSTDTNRFGIDVGVGVFVF